MYIAELKLTFADGHWDVYTFCNPRAARMSFIEAANNTSVPKVELLVHGVLAAFIDHVALQPAHHEE